MQKNRKKANAVIFGASKGGALAFDFYSADYKVLAFIDNDPQKHGGTLKGIPVIPVNSPKIFEVDKVIIASLMVYEIYDQLCSIGVHDEIIEIAPIDSLSSVKFGGRTFIRQVFNVTLYGFFVFYIISQIFSMKYRK
jgi:FlaA1/EpsC-like NDP-sugar epimerase